MDVDLTIDLSMPVAPKGYWWEVWVGKDGLTLWLRPRLGDKNHALTTMRMEEAKAMGYKQAVVSMAHAVLAKWRPAPEELARLQPIADEISQLANIGKVKVKL